MNIKRVLIGCALAGVLLCAVGCSPVMVSPDGAAYSTGKLYVSISRDMNSVYEAALVSMEKLGLTVSDKAKDVFSGRITASGADGRKVTLRLSPSGDKATTLTIHVGTTGNKERSRIVYEEIRRNLATPSKANK